MAVRALYDMKGHPLSLVVDIYNTAFVASIAEESEAEYLRMCEALTYDYFSSNLASCSIVNLADANNDLIFSKKYMAIFAHPIEGIWVAYEALSLIYSCAKEGKAGRIHLFEYKANPFLIVLADNRTVLFATPKE